MTASSAIIGYGTLLKRSTDAGVSYTAVVAEVNTITGPSPKLSFEDVSHMQSPSSYMEKLAKMIEPGQLTFTCAFLPNDATQSPTAGLMHDMAQRTLAYFALVWPFSPTVTATFRAYVSNFNPKAPVNGKMTADVTLEISGTIVYT